MGYCMHTSTLTFLLRDYNNIREFRKTLLRKYMLMEFLIEKIPVNIGITFWDPNVAPKTNTKLFFSFLLLTLPMQCKYIHFYGPMNDKLKMFEFDISDSTGKGFRLRMNCQTDDQRRVQSYSFKLFRTNEENESNCCLVEREYYDIEIF
jgi:hypothetical protein